MDHPAPDISPPSFYARVTLVTALVLLLLAAWYAVDVLLLVFGGVLLAVLLRSLADLVRRLTGLSPNWSLAVVLFVLTAIAVAGFWYLAAEIAAQFDELSRRIVQAWGHLQDDLARYEWGRRILKLAPGGEAGGADGGAATGIDILGGITTVLSTGLGALANLVIISFIGIYVAISPGLYRGGLLRLVPIPRRRRAAEVLDAVGFTLRWWLVGRLMSMAIIGVTITIGLLIMGIPLALALGLIAAVLSFVPYLGPIIAVVPAAAVAFTDEPIKAAYVAGLYLAIEMIESYLIAPLIEKWSVDLPPALTITAQAILGVLLGTLGIIFATPLAAAGMVLVKMLYVQDTLGDPIEVQGEEKPAEQAG